MIACPNRFKPISVSEEDCREMQRKTVREINFEHEFDIIFYFIFRYFESSLQNSDSYGDCWTTEVRKNLQTVLKSRF